MDCESLSHKPRPKKGKCREQETKQVFPSPRMLSQTGQRGPAKEGPRHGEWGQAPLLHSTLSSHVPAQREGGARSAALGGTTREQLPEARPPSQAVSRNPAGDSLAFNATKGWPPSP